MKNQFTIIKKYAILISITNTYKNKIQELSPMNGMVFL